MNSLRFVRNALCISGTAAMLIACGGSQPPIGAPGAMPQTPAIATRADRGGTWMLPEAKSRDLLYVSNILGATVNVYRYWQQKRVGVLTGFSEPAGECVDAAGDVYIVDYGAEKIVVYGHGGTKPINVIDDSPYHPLGCAVDFKSGTLAIANLYAGSSGLGSLAIYVHAKGVPRIYRGPLSQYASCAYDGQGNLLTTDGEYNGSYYGSGFAWLAQNSHKLVRIELRGGSSFHVFNYVHGIAWDGKYWVINGYYGNQVSRVTIKRRRGRLAGTTYISGQNGQLGPLAIYNNNPGGQGTQIVGATSYGADAVDYWKYPAGGNLIAQITTGLDRPFGVAISLKQQAK